MGEEDLNIQENLPTPCARDYLLYFNSHGPTLYDNGDTAEKLLKKIQNIDNLPSMRLKIMNYLKNFPMKLQGEITFTIPENQREEFNFKGTPNPIFQNIDECASNILEKYKYSDPWQAFGKTIQEKLAQEEDVEDKESLMLMDFYIALRDSGLDHNSIVC